MRIGSDARHAPWPTKMSAAEQVDEAARRGLEGLFFRTMLDMSPTLDPGQLREIRARIDGHGMYLESGLGKVNTYALPETPEVRALGDGDTLLGFRRMMEAAAAIGITELWVSTAGLKRYGGRLAYDRFRTDVSWSDQLVAIEKFLQKLAPIARDLGVHLNAETHEEITSFELVRLVEAIGPDVMGITFDTGNPLHRAEHPTLVAQRVAPYVRQTHLKDFALFFDPKGLLRQSRPLGHGVVDLRAVLPILMAVNPDLNLSLEAAESTGGPRPNFERPATPIALYDPEWIAGHPDLTVPELADYLSLVQRFADRVAEGSAGSWEEFDQRPYDLEEAWAWIGQSLEHLHTVLDEIGSLEGTK
ncbi:sugar phosphate isomerase/epimerase [Arthrobacter sp. MI7-26]|uniref:sugar phosphate isomerase/epimerase family protein n=1 Tax=Arthrobacter sp. MI7-26 TaxID=2993653 RepID=UPI00224895ED|nr:sugar phosphate isomerase/epimerase family protein [Arthrobacter sp. MI7-26]MCX2750456.1 sugar phosphate isomerase/epimerase [Arthrobacter sp. MI7-26]